MKKKPAPEVKKFVCTEPGCSAEYKDAAHLGIHKRSAHGIIGKAHLTAKKRRQAEAVEAAARDAGITPKRKYTKRSKQLAIIPPTPATIQSNGHQTNGVASGKFRPDAAVAVGFGRFQELCKNLATEYDLPPRSYAAALIELINAQTLR